ncbi:alpha-L-rhamnosidase-like protein [Anaerobacterium chartisolvens]|uniref:Alpha-L-rhamnosidase-like protein n=1 Tax=Anaerobacterium chartisolvens TaxID=1297424 RepID=A0A369BBF5_9FIRM|nr:trehalase family glycosidase [Anaerobacterium chartisolvens]RCX18859.1 alpha-L-rhamnosidase-like protein [Anaerobacterium chartisolvens]
MCVKWDANWIWNKKEEHSQNIYMEFRKEFELENTTEALKLHVSARNEYVVSINGRHIGRGPSPCDSDWQYYDTYELTDDMLICGKNIVTVMCYFFGNTDIVTNQMQGEAGFILQINKYEETVLSTDEAWKCRISPTYMTKTERLHRWGGYKEIYDANNEDGWMGLSYNDWGWDNAKILSEAQNDKSPWPRLISREISFLNYEQVKPISILRSEDNFGVISNLEVILKENASQNTFLSIDASKAGAFPALVWDFEREVVGRPIFEIEAPEGGVMKVSYGESLELQHMETFIFKKGKNRLMPFGRRACRFIKTTFAATPAPIKFSSLTFEKVSYKFRQEGYFESSESVLNQIWETSKYTTILNSQDHPEDCPWREKALWVVDAVVMAKVIYHVFGDTKLLRKSLVQGARIQNKDGSIPGTGPEKNNFLLPDFCAYWLIGAYDYWNYSGDLDFIKELWPNIKKLAAWFEAQVDETGLFSRADREGWWCFIDWTDLIEKKDKVSAISFLYFKVLSNLIEMSRELGFKEDAEKYEMASKRLKESIRSHLWDQERKAFVDCMNGTVASKSITLQTNFLAIWCGLLVNEEADYFLDNYYYKNLLPEVKGPFFQHIVLEVLISRERRGQAVELIKDYWGEMVARGAKTWWETFDKTTPHCTIPSTYQGNTPTYLWEGPPVSLCHGWGASPAYILFQTVLGVDVSKLGKGVVRLSNPVGAVEYAKGGLPTQWGRISVEWSMDSGKQIGKIELPQDIKVEKPIDYALEIL